MKAYQGTMIVDVGMHYPKCSLTKDSSLDELINFETCVAVEVILFGNAYIELDQDDDGKIIGQTLMTRTAPIAITSGQPTGSNTGEIP